MSSPESRETPAVSLRRATLDDVGKILELQKKVASPYAFRGLENESEATEGIKEDISNINVYLIEQANAVVGSSGYQREKDEAFISSFLIDPQFQEQGVGSRAFESILKELHDCKRITIDTGEKNEGMRALLDNFGFVKESEYKIDNGETIFRLSLIRDKLTI